MVLELVETVVPRDLRACTADELRAMVAEKDAELVRLRVLLDEKDRWFRIAMSAATEGLIVGGGAASPQSG